MGNYLLFFTTKVLGINRQTWCLGFSYLRRVCVFNTRQTLSLNLRHGRGSLMPACPPARAPLPAHPHGGAVVQAGRLSLRPADGPGDQSPLPALHGRDGADRGGWRVSSACRRNCDFVALSQKSGSLAPPGKSPPFAFPLGSFTQEGSRSGGSLVRDAPQQPGRQMAAWRSCPLPGVTVSSQGQPAWAHRRLSGHPCACSQGLTERMMGESLHLPVFALALSTQVGDDE